MEASSTRTLMFTSCDAKPFTPKIVTSSQTRAFVACSKRSVLRSEEHGKTVADGTPSRLRASASACDSGATRSKTAGHQVTRKARCIHSIAHNQPSAEISLRVKYRINRIEQSRVAERLEQALGRTLFE